MGSIEQAIVYSIYRVEYRTKRDAYVDAYSIGCCSSTLYGTA